ncbi:MAG: shikimate kinase [Candidatus Bipolaricaulia bacterium]
MAPIMNVNENIYLIGFMGAGKSTVGLLLAERTDRIYVDTDQLIVEQVERSIAAIFADNGEKYFRDLESEIIKEISRQEGLVVALGGGAPIRRRNWGRIERTGVSVYLMAKPRTLLERIETEGEGREERPLLAGLSRQEKLARIEEMLYQRAPYYMQATLIVPNEHRAPEMVVDEILSGLAELYGED